MNDTPQRAGLQSPPGSTRTMELALLASSLILSLAVSAWGWRALYVPPQSEVSGWRTASLLAGSISERELNQLGFRGQTIAYADGDYVVLLVGDSQVEAKPGCAFDWMPERRLEHHLRNMGIPSVKVFTVGSSGYGQDQQLLVVKEYFAKYRANLVLLWETPENDVWNNMFPTHWPTNGTPKPTFRLEAGQLIGPSEQMEQALPGPSWWERFRKRPGRDETWGQYLPPAYAPLTSYEGPVNRAWDEVAALLVNENFDNEKTHRSIFLMPRSPRMQYGVELTHRLLAEIARTAEQQGAAFATLLTAHLRSEVMPVKSLEPEVYLFRGKYYRASRRQRDDNVRDINAGFRSFEIPVTVEHPSIGPADSHLNEHGVDQVMHDLAQQLRPLAFPGAEKARPPAASNSAR